MHPIYIIIMIFAILAGYIITSLFFLKYPNFLHRKKCPKFRARHISHRGGAGENLENTMTAFHHAHNNGADMLELDCHITKDEQVVVSHDNYLNRVCGCDVLISDCNYEDLPPLLRCLKLDFLPTHITNGSKEDRQIPLLEEVFQAFPNTPINLDIKINNDLLIKKVGELIKKYCREEITVWGNKLNLIAEKCYKENPKIPIFFSLRRVMILLFLFYSGILPFVPLKEKFFEVVMPRGFLNRKRYDIEGFQRFVLHIADILIMRPALIKHLEKRGIETYIWVLNNEEEFQRAFQLGAVGVMTDFPSKMKKFLDEHPQNHKG